MKITNYKTIVCEYIVMDDGTDFLKMGAHWYSMECDSPSRLYNKRTLNKLDELLYEWQEENIR